MRFLSAQFHGGLELRVIIIYVPHTLYMLSNLCVALLVFCQEVEARSLSVRLHGGQELGAIPMGDLISRVVKAIASKGAFQNE